jgi:uncharacterized membrane protein YczE
MNIKHAIIRVCQLVFGLFLFSLGIILIVHANLGAPAWDVFHLGIVKHSNLTFGRAGIFVGIFVIMACIYLKEIPGWGTFANWYLIGVFLDLIENQGWMPYAKDVLLQAAMLFSGVLAIGIGTFFYMNTGLGTGPRDGLMMGLAKKLSGQIWIIRTCIEVSVALMGYLLGGPLGIGTVLSALLIGPAVQLVYRVGRKDPKSIKHTNILDDYRRLFKKAEAID